jgi:uncharacterized membrane protein
LSRYEILLFLHIACAILWLGAGACLILIGGRADKSRDPVRIKQIVEDAEWVSNRLIIPSSLAVLVLGIVLVVDGPWTFDMLWVVLGLLGFAATFVTGFFFITPQTKRIAATMERDGGMSPAAIEQVRKLFLISRIDLVVLFTVVADMALKPTGDDVGTLVLMVAAIAAAAVYATWRFRSSTATGTPAREPV